MNNFTADGSSHKVARIRDVADRLRRIGEFESAEMLRAFAERIDAEGDGGAVGEKVCIDAVGRVEIDMTGDIGVNWVLEGGIHALEEGTWILCADREVTDDEGYGELYTQPARSGVVSDEDVEAACCKYYNCGHPVYPPVFEGMRAALEHFAKGERHER